MGARQEHLFPSSIQIQAGGNIALRCLILNRFPVAHPCQRILPSMYQSRDIYDKPPWNPNVITCPRWSDGVDRVGRELVGGRLGAAETPGRHHTSAGTQAVGAWMGFCHEWITTRNVRWGEDESFTRLSLLIPCVHQGWARGWGVLK